MADSNTTNNNTDAQRIATLEAALAAVRAEMQDFSYTVSHDLRASLRHILSYAHWCRKTPPPCCHRRPWAL
jgi:light-regulated signal transduction histidine kinase (bacteriophytochrome)